MQNVKILWSEGDWAELRQKLFCSNIPRQNIWKKKEKSSETGQDKKTWISNFAYFLTAIAKV